MNDNGLKVFAGFVIGALAGVVTGLLVAPNTGSGTRKKISDTAKKFKHDLKDFAEEQIETTKKNINDAVDELLNEHKAKDKTTAEN